MSPCYEPFLQTVDLLFPSVDLAPPVVNPLRDGMRLRLFEIDLLLVQRDGPLQPGDTVPDFLVATHRSVPSCHQARPSRGELTMSATLPDRHRGHTLSSNDMPVPVNDTALPMSRDLEELLDERPNLEIHFANRPILSFSSLLCAVMQIPRNGVRSLIAVFVFLP